MSAALPGSIPSVRRRAVVAITVGALIAGLVGTRTASPADAASFPSMRLLTTSSFERVERWEGEPIYLPASVYVASVGGGIDLRVRSPRIGADPVVDQIAPGASRRLPAWVAKDFSGLRNFIEVRVTDRDGEVVLDDAITFCPNSWDSARLDPDGPARSPFPDMCWSGPFVRGMRWGIGDGWATAAIGWNTAMGPPTFEAPDGTYRATFTIAERFRTLFGIPSRDATVTTSFSVHTLSCGDWCWYEGDGPMVGRGGATRDASSIPIVSSPGADAVPDLQPMPAWGISLEIVEGRELLSFATTIANLGTSDLRVEGFRSPGQDEMAAWQYFLRDGRVIGRAAVGTFGYDDRRGHDHWHFRQFASYRLLTGDGEVARPGTKEAWCLAPTDPIDLLLPDAAIRPGTTDFSICGGPTTLWVREVLPVGWADTYWSGLPGQSFDVTGLPNGTYVIEFTVNPRGVLRESSTTNNVSRRIVVIEGDAGARTVTVRPWRGLELP